MTRMGFGELELAILEKIRREGPCNVHNVHAALGKEKGYTTIMTVMTRLVKKGELSRKKEGKQYIYCLATEKKRPFVFLKRLKEKFFEGKALALVSYFLETDPDLEEKDLKEIEALIKKKRKEKES